MPTRRTQARPAAAEKVRSKQLLTRRLGDGIVPIDAAIYYRPTTGRPKAPNQSELNLHQRYRHDVLVIGSGAAGLTAALALAGQGRVAVLTKGHLSDGSTAWAQGGVAAVMDPTDSVEAHVQDTLTAGAGLCAEDAVRFTVERAAAAIEALVKLGVHFDVEDDRYHLTREGGHSFRRVLHVADATGAAISRALIDKVAATPSIEVFERHIGIDLITARKLPNGEEGPDRCYGAYVLDASTGDVQVFEARFVVLATGGASKVYVYTTNPDTATGDGIAMAWRAGCRVANLEFNQFHPTCLFHPHAKSFLISEAVRGEGGRLLLPDGTPFMHRFHPDAELAPRDIVARAIDHELKRLGLDCVYLDISHRTPEFIHTHFPNIANRCLELGIDITKQPIPVVPAAHYTCGGVIVDRAGRTDLANLYTIGETSSTGLHGANRMASNSLLECLVYAQSAAEHIQSQWTGDTNWPAIADWDESRVTDSDEEVVISHNWDEVRRFMWDYVGIVRTNKRLERAAHRIDLLKAEIRDYYRHYRVSADLLELRNLVQTADLIVRCARRRRESRGLHYTLDYPGLLADARDTILTPVADNTALDWPRTGMKTR